MHHRRHKPNYHENGRKYTARNLVRACKQRHNFDQDNCREANVYRRRRASNALTDGATTRGSADNLINSPHSMVDNAQIVQITTMYSNLLDSIVRREKTGDGVRASCYINIISAVILQLANSRIKITNDFYQLKEISEHHTLRSLAEQIYYKSVCAVVQE